MLKTYGTGFTQQSRSASPGFPNVVFHYQSKAGVGHLWAYHSVRGWGAETKLSRQWYDDIGEVDARWGRMISEGLRGWSEAHSLWVVPHAYQDDRCTRQAAKAADQMHDSRSWYFRKVLSAEWRADVAFSWAAIYFGTTTMVRVQGWMT